MKRLSALLCLLNIWMAASMLLVFDYTEVRVNVYRGSALGLPDAFYEFSVYRPQTPSSGASSEAASSSETTIEDEQTPEGAAAQAGLSLTMKIVVAVAVIAGLALIIGVVVLKKRGKSAE